MSKLYTQNFTVTKMEYFVFYFLQYFERLIIDRLI